MDKLYIVFCKLSRACDEANECLEKKVDDYNWGYRDAMQDATDTVFHYIEELQKEERK